MQADLNRHLEPSPIFSWPLPVAAFPPFGINLAEGLILEARGDTASLSDIADASLAVPTAIALLAFALVAVTMRRRYREPGLEKPFKNVGPADRRTLNVAALLYGMVLIWTLVELARL